MQIMAKRRNYEELGDIELSVKDDREITARINQAEKELDDLRISFRWGKEQLEVVKRAADTIGIPYQTFLKLDVLKDVESSKPKGVA
jgi:predicted DNA binding CopG/RHH family protein